VPGKYVMCMLDGHGRRRRATCDQVSIVTSVAMFAFDGVDTRTESRMCWLEIGATLVI
jgi:hypothetical protein